MEKKQYIAPCIELIKLDNEISLALESSPPGGPNETWMNYLEQNSVNSNTVFLS